MVVPLVVDLGVLLAAVMNRRGVFCVVHVEFVFAEDVRAEVLGQLRNTVDFDLEVKCAVEQVFGLDVILEIVHL